MKKTFTFSLLLISFINAGRLVADEPGYRFSIHVAAPPAAVQVVDQAGRRLGVDYGKPLDQYGRQGSPTDGLKEIPNSSLQQENLPDEEGPNFGAPSTKTFWDLEIKYVTAPETLKINLLGISNGIVAVPIEFRKGISVQQMQTVDLNSLCQKGKQIQLEVTLNPASGAMTSKRIVSVGQLSADVQAACNLKAISPAVACSVLEDLAHMADSHAAKVSEKKQALQLFIRILDRLHNFGSKGNRDWDDFKDESRCQGFRDHKQKDDFFAKDPSYTILKEEAQALLDGLPKESGHDKDGHRDGDDDHKDDHHDGDDRK